MRTTVVRDVRAALESEARRAADPLALERVVAAQVRRAVPFDLWCGLLTDPGTGEATGAFHDDGLPARHLPRLVELEARQGDRDFVGVRELVTGRESSRSLAAATGGDLPRSHRYRDVLAPSGIRHEVRWALRTADGRAWGVLVLMRGTGERDFSDQERRVLASAGRPAAEGLRRALVVSADAGPTDRSAPAPAPAATEGPGLLLCRVAERITVDHASEAARRWLEELDDGGSDALPYALAAPVYAAGRQHGTATRRVRARGRSGRWVTAHVERLGPASVSVILEPTRPAEMADLLADAYGLTARERQVAALAARGLTNREIAATAYLSPFTVQDHLKAAFAKTGTRSRAELAATLGGPG